MICLKSRKLLTYFTFFGRLTISLLFSNVTDLEYIIIIFPANFDFKFNSFIILIKTQIFI